MCYGNCSALWTYVYGGVGYGRLHRQQSGAQPMGTACAQGPKFGATPLLRETDLKTWRVGGRRCDVAHGGIVSTKVVMEVEVEPKVMWAAYRVIHLAYGIGQDGTACGAPLHSQNEPVAGLPQNVARSRHMATTRTVIRTHHCRSSTSHRSQPWHHFGNSLRLWQWNYQMYI